MLDSDCLGRVNRWFTGETSGEGGIRTLGTLLEYGALAKRCFRPLSHLTQIGCEVSAGGKVASIWNLLDVQGGGAGLSRGTRDACGAQLTAACGDVDATILTNRTR